MATTLYWRVRYGHGAFRDVPGNLLHPLVAGILLEYPTRGDQAIVHPEPPQMRQPRPPIPYTYLLGFYIIQCSIGKKRVVRAEFNGLYRFCQG